MSTDYLNRSILPYFKKICKDKDCQYIDSLIVSTYIHQHNIEVNNNILLRQYIIRHNKPDDLSNFIEYLEDKKIILSLEDIVRFFEFVISPIEKEVNGAVYTPISIRDYITNSALSNFAENEWHNLLIADISCGCGGFFITIIDKIRQHVDIPLETLYCNIYGVDIADYSIERTKILLCLYAVTHGEDIECFDYNLFVANSLEFDWSTNANVVANGGFDIIIGNPPYVSSVKISNESKALLDRWEVCRTGKPDLYIPFFQIAIELLNDNGILSYITVSNFYRSLNGRAFRRYMSENLYNFSIIDFGAEQVFKGRSTYTCICNITREQGGITYFKSSYKYLDKIKNDDFIHIPYNILSDKDGWLLQDNNVAENINIIESTGIPLYQYCNIKNGFATLKNDVYILDIEREDDVYYYITSKQKIEKSICRDAIKPNTLKHEDELIAKTEKLLFPYTLVDGVLNIISEDELATEYPYAYEYLKSNKESLLRRDKGQREYVAWYAFGRSQALTIDGYKLLFPYIADKPYFVISQDKGLLFYNGYALVSDNIRRLEIARKVLRSKVFWYYIKHTSKPYGSDYFALAKNYIKNFGIPDLSTEKETELLSIKTDFEIDNFLLKEYNLSQL